MRVSLDVLRLEAERRRRLAERQAELDDLRQILQTSYREFVRYFWHVLNPSTPLVEDRGFDCMVEHMQAFYAPPPHRQIHNLLYHGPPGTAKTMLGVCLPNAWRWASDPTWGLLSSSNKENYAKHSDWTRKIVMHPSYQVLWPLKMNQSTRSKALWELEQGGWRIAVNYLSGYAGAPAHDIVGDDIQTEDDEFNKPRCHQQEEKLFKGFWARLRDKDKGGMMLIGQRNWAFDIYNYARVENPNLWDAVCIEARKTTVSMATYFKTTTQGLERVEMPLMDTAITRSGLYVDDRDVGELLSDRIPHEYLDSLPVGSYMAQQQQQPVVRTSDAARLNVFDRAQHLRRFAARMGEPTLARAVARALSEGWRIGSGWDHGLDAHREVGQLVIWSEKEREAWAIMGYANPERRTVLEDAIAFRETQLDPLCVPPARVQGSRGDVGSMGKGAPKGPAGSINLALSEARYESGPRRGERVLGFTIATASKHPLASEEEVINEGFGAGSLYLDESAEPLAVAIENWTGGEAHKDRVDAWRYMVSPILRRWRALKPGRSGVATG